MSGALSDSGLMPVHPVGHYQGRLLVLDHTGRLVDLSASALGRRSVLRDLFGDERFLSSRFPQFDRHGNRLIGFDRWTCIGWLVRESHRRGLIDPTTLAVRGVGVWRDGGRLAVHLGDRVLFMPGDGGVSTMHDTWSAGRRAIYASRPAMSAPRLPATAKTAQRAERLFGMWRWSVSWRGTNSDWHLVGSRPVGCRDRFASARRYRWCSRLR